MQNFISFSILFVFKQISWSSNLTLCFLIHFFESFTFFIFYHCFLCKNTLLDVTQQNLNYTTQIIFHYTKNFFYSLTKVFRYDISHTANFSHIFEISW